MAERKAVNKYYPPEWTPDQGSINKFVGQHPLRERARKIKQGILIIRFEMPFNIWCSGCENHIGKGVRYNAEKKKIGSYFSTKIWSFRMKCHLCDNYIEIKTDPQACDYVIVSGGRRKVETWDEKANETVVLSSADESSKLSADPFYKLEHQTEDQRKAAQVAPSLVRLQELKAPLEDDYSLIRTMRKTFREKTKSIEKERQDNKQKGIYFDLLPGTEEDKQEASKAFLHKSFGYPVISNAVQTSKKRKFDIKSSSIFEKKLLTNQAQKVPGSELSQEQQQKQKLLTAFHKLNQNKLISLPPATKHFPKKQKTSNNVASSLLTPLLNSPLAITIKKTIESEQTVV